MAYPDFLCPTNANFQRIQQQKVALDICKSDNPVRVKFGNWPIRIYNFQLCNSEKLHRISGNSDNSVSLLDNINRIKFFQGRTGISWTGKSCTVPALLLYDFINLFEPNHHVPKHLTPICSQYCPD